MSKNLKLKKVNKSIVPEAISCFSDSYMLMNILRTYVHFTCSYLGRIFLDVDMLHQEIVLDMI